MLDVDAWLGVDVLNELGKPIRFSDRVINSLKEVVKDGTLDENDVPADGAVLDEDDFKKFARSMLALLADGSKLKSPPIVLLDTDALRFETWLKGRYTEDVQLKTPKREQTMTPELKSDMDAQGMTEFDDLAFTELTVHLGRPAGPLERVDGAHNSPPTTMAGARTAKKHGAPNFDQVVAAALEASSIDRINSWIMNVTQRCTNSRASPFAPKAANLINTWWSKALRLKDPRVIAWYVTEYRAAYVGRGFPVEIDTEILALARAEAAPAAKVFGEAALKSGSSDAGSTASGYSALGSSASGVGQEQSDKLVAQLTSFGEILTSLQSRLSSLEAGGGGGGGGAGAGGGAAAGPRERPPGSCFICHSMDHKIDKCPMLPFHIKASLKKTKGKGEEKEE